MLARPKLDAGSLDKVGATTSLLCAVHCALLPFVATLLPLWGLTALADDRVEWLLVTSALVIALISFMHGYRRHRSKRALVMLSCALPLLLSGRMAEELAWSFPGEALLVAGGLALVAAHGLNFHLGRCALRASQR